MARVCVNHVTIFRVSETASIPFSNIATTGTSGLQLERSLCRIEDIEIPITLSIGTFSFDGIFGDHMAIFENITAETDFRKLQILP
jgi:hypothetical protein